MPNSAGKRFKPTKYIPVSTAATLLVGSTTLFFVFTCPWLAKVISPAVPFYNGLVFLFVLANFSMATFMDPGVYPRANEDEDKDDDFRAPLYKNVEIKGIQVRMKWCATCHFYRPPRCSHCSVCDNCVERVLFPGGPTHPPLPCTDTGRPSGPCQRFTTTPPELRMMADNAGSLAADAPSNEKSPEDLQDSGSDALGPKAEGDPEAPSNPDKYRYIKVDLFTSEIFKVEIRNLPKFIGFNDLKKFLAKHGINPHKIKLFGKHTCAFVTFKNEEERDKALKMVHGMQWKGQVLSVRLAKPKQDPILKKRKQEEGEGAGQPASKRAEGDEEERPLSVQIANVVTPLWEVPYEEQLKRKEEEVVGVLQKLAKEIGSTNKAMLPWLFAQKGKHNKMCCPLEAIRPSPTQKEYRNKCEFLISMGADGEDKTIGFRLGKYKGGSCAVVGPSETCHVSAAAKTIVREFQKFIRTTSYSVYSPETYEGHWKQLTVRTTRSKEAMAVIFFNPQKLEEEELDALKSSMRAYFTEGDGKESGVTSLYFVRDGQRKSPNPEDLPCELVAGESCIHEELLGLKFRISPHSFFQVNTAAAEVLYSTVGDWAQLDQDSTVLDVCCGTGTIGISLAKRVKKVIGIELCQEAVEDAKVNAKLNGLSNVEFHCGRAEDVFPDILNALVSPNLTAVVDPPRAGLHPKVVLAIRRAEHLKRLVYVACNAKAAMTNFIDLCRAPSNRVHGAPFRPVRAMAVDLFPQTMHVEMLLLFERVDYKSQEQT